jgi:hypothetical protein
MKNFYASLVAMVVLVALSPVSVLADTWGEPINTPGARFVVLTSYNNQAVLDHETGLVWEQSPSTTLRIWSAAQSDCNVKTVGNRKGWRLPTIQELASLVDPTVPSPGPTLPAGHPFSNVQSTGYWSATATGATSAWVVDFFNGLVVFTDKSGSLFVWCVRGGQGVNPQ